MKFKKRIRRRSIRKMIVNALASFLSSIVGIVEHLPSHTTKPYKKAKLTTDSDPVSEIHAGSLLARKGYDPIHSHSSIGSGLSLIQEKKGGPEEVAYLLTGKGPALVRFEAKRNQKVAPTPPIFFANLPLASSPLLSCLLSSSS